MAAAQVFDRQAARGAAQHLLLRALAQMHVVEQHVSRTAREHPALDVHPGAQAATPLADISADVQVRAQLCPVQAVKGGVPLALPVLPAPGVQRPQRLGKHALQAQALAPVGGRVGVDAQRMGEVPVAQHHVHVRQLQRRGVAQRVGPTQGAVANGQFGLAKNPVGSGAVATVGLGQGKAADPNHAVGLALHVKHRAVNIELLQAARQKRARRHGGNHARELQRRVALGVKHLHAAQFDRGNQPVGLRADAANAHHRAQGARGLFFEPRAQSVDSRHNDKVQGHPHQRQQQPASRHQPQRPFG